MFIGIDGQAAGLIALADTIKPGRSQCCPAIAQNGNRGGDGHR